ncbi:hypothetical protein QYM36_004449 [Artemia franciscana]|uniref:Apple domain-containing protein n=2 Tax=Artemia franciscana TaxID=6661 RepID=A0AA88IA07_ARTSF|nr:hypothetical protein QYM36_004449 [Artemia franciscana]
MFCQLVGYFTSKYKNSDNCELSDVDVGWSTFYLTENRDYDTWYRTDFSRNCNAGSDDVESISIDTVKEMTYASSLASCQKECLKKRSFNCNSVAYTDSYQSKQLRGNCELSPWEADDLDRSRELLYDNGYYVYARIGKECGEAGGYGYSLPGSDVNDVSTSGVDCISRCQENKNMGYWFCDIDNRGAWDYCCSPSSKCGYSEGQPIPW